VELGAVLSASYLMDVLVGQAVNGREEVVVPSLRCLMYLIVHFFVPHC